MTRAEIVKNIIRTKGIDKSVCNAVLDGFESAVIEALVGGEKVALREFITIEPTYRKGHRGRNPKTGEIMDIPASTSIKCKASQRLKDLMNKDGGF